MAFFYTVLTLISLSLIPIPIAFLLTYCDLNVFLSQLKCKDKMLINSGLIPKDLKCEVYSKRVTFNYNNQPFIVYIMLPNRKQYIIDHNEAILIHCYNVQNKGISLNELEDMLEKAVNFYDVGYCRFCWRYVF